MAIDFLMPSATQKAAIELLYFSRTLWVPGRLCILTALKSLQ